MVVDTCIWPFRSRLQHNSFCHSKSIRELCTLQLVMRLVYKYSDLGTLALLAFRYTEKKSLPFPYPTGSFFDLTHRSLSPAALNGWLAVVELLTCLDPVPDLDAALLNVRMANWFNRITGRIFIFNAKKMFMNLNFRSENLVKYLLRKDIVCVCVCQLFWHIILFFGIKHTIPREGRVVHITKFPSGISFDFIYISYV